MYSGTTFRVKSGLIMGVHQRIDRVAYRNIKDRLPTSVEFPSIRSIIHFEGLNGPDGIKRKSPGIDEPWHFIDPKNPDDHALRTMIRDHIINMANALSAGNQQRAAFEAAWMAHAITDGLTPAHHYPLEAKLVELRGGQGLVTRDSTKEKLLMHGATKRQLVRNNWQYWGAKGVMTTHVGFELGVATTIAAQRFSEAIPSDEQLEAARDHLFDTIFMQSVHAVADLNMYERFSRIGWTQKIARQTREQLMPIILNTVQLGWYAAASKADQKNGTLMVYIRIIGGTLGGRKIDTPPGRTTHPMGDRVRTAIFNMLQQKIVSAAILDAFAGTGALGFEALSRGASFVIAVEKNRLAKTIISANAEALRLGDNHRSVKAGVAQRAETYKGERFDIIFADPPYHDTQFSTIRKLFGLLKPGGTMVLSHPGRGEVPTGDGIVVVDNRVYGNSVITVYHKKDAL